MILHDILCHIVIRKTHDGNKDVQNENMDVFLYHIRDFSVLYADKQCNKGYQKKKADLKNLRTFLSQDNEAIIQDMWHEKASEKPQHAVEHLDGSQKPKNGIGEVRSEKERQSAVRHPTEEEIRNENLIGFFDQEFFETWIFLEKQTGKEEVQRHTEIPETVVEQIDISVKTTMKPDDQDNAKSFHQVNIFDAFFRCRRFHNKEQVGMEVVHPYPIFSVSSIYFMLV